MMSFNQVPPSASFFISTTGIVADLNPQGGPPLSIKNIKKSAHSTRSDFVGLSLCRLRDSDNSR